ncbi:MAG: DUF881 domain-containing protein [Bacillota bacterium]
MVQRYFSIALVGLILGLLLVLQFRTTNQEESTVPGDRAHQLTVELKTLAEERAGLESVARDLEGKLARARLGYVQAEETINAQIREASVLAGVTSMVGPGVRVTITSRTGATPPGAIFAVRDEDLLKLVNELRVAEAEALSINGQRLISTSAIRLAGSHINVNLQRITPPYEILAIGDPVALRSSLEIKGGLVETLRDWGMDVLVETENRIIIPAYKRPLVYEYAKPVKEASQ